MPVAAAVIPYAQHNAARSTMIAGQRHGTALQDCVAGWRRRRCTHTVCLGSTNNFFPIFICYAYFDMLLKGMGESFILSEDEPLSPDIDGVMAL